MWLANLLYSEQLAWPFDIFITTNYTDTTFAGAPARIYPFVIPLFSHMENLKHFLNSGMANCGSVTFPIPCSSYTTDRPFIHYSNRQPLDYFFSNIGEGMIQGQVSSGQGVSTHSWSSFSSGHWYVLCNSFSVSPTTGGMTPSAYIPHEAFNTTRDFPGGVYTNPIDSVSPRAGTVKQFYTANGTMPSGYWGSSVAIPSSLNFNPELCWRESMTSLSIKQVRVGYVWDFNRRIPSPPPRPLLDGFGLVWPANALDKAMQLGKNERHPSRPSYRVHLHRPNSPN